MEKQEATNLQVKLRDKLNDVSYSISTDKSQTLIVFLDSLFKEALENGVRHYLCDSESNDKKTTPFDTYIGLNGDKCMLYWVENKGIENIDVFVKYEANN